MLFLLCLADTLIYEFIRPSAEGWAFYEIGFG
jgi:hypothetical protein